MDLGLQKSTFPQFPNTSQTARRAQPTAEPRMSSNEPTRSNAAGAALTYPRQASHIHKGDFIVIENRPCKCVHSTSLKNGKHGHAKAVITAVDIFTGRKHVAMLPASHPVDVPHVGRAEYPVVCIHDTGMLSLLADDGKGLQALRLLCFALRATTHSLVFVFASFDQALSRRMLPWTPALTTCAASSKRASLLAPTARTSLRLSSARWARNASLRARPALTTPLKRSGR